jgi:hypothetical protein
VSNNRTRTKGGGVYQASGPLTLKNATLSGNLAEMGGGLYLNGGNANLNNLTITQNAVTSAAVYAYGGGMYVVNAATLSLRNSIIAGNTADLGKDCSGVVDSGGNNLIGWADGCSISAGNGNLLGTRTAPIDALLGVLRNNGGPTFTHALLTGSPAIDAGNPATCLATDQRGVARPAGAACDIGAFEGAASQTVSGLIRTYTAGNQQVLPGTFKCDQTHPACTSGANPHADQAHKYAIGTWNLYKTKHGRVGIDGDNMPVISTVHFANNYQNAFWSGAQMVYGDGFGFPLADDVVAHELTHGVTERESALFYYMESGAINESLSDVWGEYYDQTNGLGNDTSGVKWKLGEDVTGLGAIRSMSNPPAYNDPDRMLSSLFYKGTNDLGGVHQNSGVNNKTAFLMARGGSITFNGKTVTGLGWLKTAAVYYEAQTHYLTTASDYADLYNILYQSCLNLVGTRGITTANCQEVRDATDAVEMNKRPAGYRVQTGFCPAGQTKSADLFYDGLETNATKWSFTHQVGNNHWTRQNFYPVAGSYHLFGNDYDPTRVNNNQRSKSAAQFKNGVAIPASGAYYLHFKHAFEFETSQSNGSTYYWDGAVLEYSTNGGSTWVDAKPLFNAGKNYGGTVTAYGAGQSPLAGRQGFVDTSNGYVSTRYKLSTLAGQTVKFRWVVGTDYTGWANLGWAVDEIRIYRCVP